MNGNELRRLVNKAARMYADRYRLPYYLSLNQTEPTVLFPPDQEALLHGNFHSASYSAICDNREWVRRLRKLHSRRTALPTERRAEAMELDSCTSSDALLMNVFCYPGLFLHDPFVRLMGLPATAEPDLVFGFKPRVPLRRSHGDATEVDLRVEDMLVEAKLTENDFTRKRHDAVERYRDFAAVFDSSILQAQDGYYLHYQLIRNVLAAYHLGSRFRLICDARRCDLIEAARTVLTAIRFPNLRRKCGIITWQEIARCAPEALGSFLRDKYDVAPSDRLNDDVEFRTSLTPETEIQPRDQKPRSELRD